MIHLRQEQIENMGASNSIHMVKTKGMNFCHLPMEGLTPSPQFAPQPILG